MGRKDRHRSKGELHPESTSISNLPKYDPIKLTFALILLILAVVIVYSPSLKVPFLLDDYGKIIRNPDIKSLANIPSRLIYPYGPQPEFHRNDPSRPLTYLTLTLDYYFHQLDPAGYHVSNIILHILVVLLVFLLASLAFPLVGKGGILLPFISALLFAVHPINVNVVTYVMGRAASLATVFYVLAVILFIQARRGIKWCYVVSIACFVLALASNQLALTLPAIFLLTDYCFCNQGNLAGVLRGWRRHLGYWLILMTYLLARVAYFGGVGDLEAEKLLNDRTTYFITQVVVLWKYIGMIFFPAGLSFEHLFNPIKQATDLRVLLSIGLFIFLLLIFFRFIRHKNFLPFFGILWFLITILPTSSFFPTTAMLAENRVYLPVIGICLIFPLLGKFVIEWMGVTNSLSNGLIVVCLCLACLLGTLTFQRNTLYQTPTDLWMDVIQHYPNHIRAHKNLAVGYLNRGIFEKAAREAQIVISNEPDDSDALNTLAAAYYQLGNYNGALKTYLDILGKNPNSAPTYHNMGILLEDMHDIEGAIGSYKNALKIDPRLVDSMNNLANLYVQKGLLEEASGLYEAALKIDPNNVKIRENFRSLSKG